jgi:hypothetical protein
MKQAEIKEIAADAIGRLSACREDSECFVTPFRHLICDNFLHPELAHKAMNAFPDLADPCWEHENTANIEVKSRTTWKSEFDIPDDIIDVIRIMNSAPFLSALSEKLKIPKLMPDPYFSGGGLNVSSRGGLLDVHVDGNYHDASGLNRRANAIFYLNKDWEQSWGGGLGLYDASGKVCEKVVEPLFNRLFVFDSHDFSFHGLPAPITCPADRNRKSVILYYYTVESRPKEHVSISAPHSALWVRKGLLDKRGSKVRNYF